MAKTNKRFKSIQKIVDKHKVYTIEEALERLQECPKIKFDESIDISLKLGIDPKKSDQQVRGTVSLPHGTGKTTTVLVFAQGAKAEEAKTAGADYVGGDELIQKVKGGWTEFDAVITTPDLMREVGKLGKVLGPRGLMPTPKAGTVTTDVAKAVSEIKMGKIEFKADKNAGVNSAVGKLSFPKDSLKDNIKAFIQAVMRLKPASAKGEYIQSFTVSSTMGPGLKVDVHSVA
ncbi:MAG: 50S ribosomal protein L1 [Simkaniaceae bacterium]